MKIKALLSSILVMALCLTVIAGSTFALFTDSKELNIAVTSGNVEVDAAFSLVKTYSAVKADSAATKYLVDENEKTYEHVAQEDYKFSNGGDAKIEDGKLVVSLITPGDKVEAKITVKNVGNVAMIYRYIIEVDAEAGINNKLADGMVITAEGKQYEKINSFTSEWSAKIDVNGAKEHTFALELPVFAGNEYQSEEGDKKEVAYKVTVEAVQANADMSTEINYERIFTIENQTQLQKALDNTASYTDKAFGFNIVGDIVGNVTVPQREGIAYTIYGNGYTFDGMLTVNGKSATFTDNNLIIKDLNFASANVAKDKAFINFGNGGKNDPTRYVTNVTIDNCTFDYLGTGEAACIKSFTGGCKNITVTNCVAKASTHSLLQLKGTDGITVTGCEIYSKNGINIGTSLKINIDDCKFDIKGYAFRAGDTGAIDEKNAKEFNISNCTIKSIAEDITDTAIIIRGTAGYCTLNLFNVEFDASNNIENIGGAIEGKTTIHNQ